MVIAMPSRAPRAALLGTVLSLLLATPALGATFNVAPDGADGSCSPCRTLTGALAHAAENSEADTINMAPGSYTEPGPVEVDDEVTINGAGIAATVVAIAPNTDGATITFTEPGAINGILVLKAGGTGAALATEASLDIDRVWTLNTSGAGLSVVSPSTGADGTNVVNADSSMFSAAKDHYGISVTSPPGLLPLSTSPDDVDLRLRHVTVAGPDGALGISLDASQTNYVGDAKGNMAATVENSIVDGNSQTKSRAASVGVSANTATIAFTAENLADPVDGDAGGPPDADAATLFWSPKDYVFLLRQTATAAIDKGTTDAGAGEPANDVYGDPRKSGAATDLGADEWVNLVPAAEFSANPEQGTVGQKVTFTATSKDPEAGFGGGITQYYWDFGDGEFAKTTTPVVEHTYTKEGDKFVRLAVEDNTGAISEPKSLKFVVHPVKDAAAPAVHILQPKAGQRLRLRGKRPRPGARRRPLQLTVLGGVTDATGIKQVDVALRLVERRRGARPRGGMCEFYNGSRRFRKRDCDEPVWLKVSRTNNVWRFRSRKGYRLPPGRYQLRARGTDIVGNVSSASEIAQTLVGFRIR